MGLHFREKGRGCSAKKARLWFLALAGLGMVIFLFSSCGSDNTPKPAASAKKEKAAQSGSNQQPVIALLSPKKGGTSPQLRGKVPGMPPPEEIEAKRAEAMEAGKKVGPNEVVFPGITKGELEAKIAAEQARKPNPISELFPGLTAEQLDAKMKAQREKRAAATKEILPGLTGEQLNAKAAQARQMTETQGNPLKLVFPPK